MKLTGWKDVVGQETTLDLERKGANNWTVKSPPGYKLSTSQAESFLGLLSLVRAERCEELRKGLEKLKRTDRETLVAFYIQGRSLKQMSREFETPVGTIKRRLHVARNRLRACLERGEDATRRAARRRELACV